MEDDATPATLWAVVGLSGREKPSHPENRLMKKMFVLLVATITLQACSWAEITVREGAPTQERRAREAVAAAALKAMPAP
ncbi:hypothetical protein GCM10007856_36570 [Azospirillum oryzae]|nr:hypothetical protein GCM10007856_36570 [Azospirillum oryzae]